VRMEIRETRRQEAGFAMLVVFLLAAFVAISLYMELPRAVFESQRNREQTLIDRGEQYRRAIQVYYRAFQRYPPDLDALDNTNNRRFLRHRYRDPMTDKDEWRLIHAVAPGVFPDSLVYKTPGQKDQTGNETAAVPVEATAPIWMQRRPSDGTVPPGPPDANAPAETSMENPPDAGITPVQPPFTDQGTVPSDQQRPSGFPAIAPPGQMYPVQPGATSGQQPGPPVVGGPVVPFGQSPVQIQPGLVAPTQIQPVPFVPGLAGGQVSAQAPGAATAPQSSPIPGQPASGGNPALDIIRTILTTPNPRGLSGIPSASNTQQSTTPLLAGVASNLEEDSIKVYNDRTKYNEWEFIYDPRQDKLAMARAQTAQPQTGVVPTGPGTGGPGTGLRPGVPTGQGPQNPFGPPVGFPPMGPGGTPQPVRPGRGR
jgi:type II secretory pathway pseudopilin PulG